MILLALEFSSAERSVALVEHQPGGGKVQVLASVSDSSTGNATPLCLVQLALVEAHLRREAIEGVIVGLGPGSYTGIRSALAMAQGWRLAAGASIIGVGSVGALAVQAQILGWHGRVGIVIDAQRGEFYLAIYRIGVELCRVDQPLRLAGPREVQASLDEENSLLIGPGARRWFAQARDLFPQAQVLAQLEAQWVRPAHPEELEPIYLRTPEFVKALPPRIMPS